MKSSKTFGLTGFPDPTNLLRPVFAMFFPRFKFGLAAASCLLATLACDDPLALRPPFDESFVDTLTLHALRGTPISAPSGYNVARRQPARTDRAVEPFDFAFDIDGDTSSLIFTTGALGLARSSGIQLSDRPFDEIEVAPLEDYERDSSLAVIVGSVFIIRSRPSADDCPFFLGALPRYGKFQVLEIESNARQITLEALVNINCGYRSLEPGLPTR